MESITNFARRVTSPVHETTAAIARGIANVLGRGDDGIGAGGGADAGPGAQSRASSLTGLTAREGAARLDTASTTSTIQINTPMSFLFSRYTLCLVALSLLVNRIHVHVPPRRILQQNPASVAHPALTRFLLRLPGLLALARGVLMLGLRCGWNRFDMFSPGSGGTLWEWTLGNGMSEEGLLWTTFLSVAVACLSETFVRCLEDDADRTHGFNLLSFAFLLHIHSPLSGDNASAPTQHHLHLLLTLLELFFLHLSFSLPASFADRILHPTTLFRSNTHSIPHRHHESSSTALRLPITAFFSLLAQMFFLNSLIRDFESLHFGVPSSHGGPRRHLTIETPAGGGGEGEGEGGAGAGRREQVVYEIETIGWEGTVWLNRAPEMAMELLIGVSLGLRALAALFRGEEFTQESILGHPSHWPRLDDDFAVSMIRYGTSLLESTRLAGLANEVSPITAGAFNLFSSAFAEPESTPTAATGTSSALEPAIPTNLGPNPSIPAVSLSSSSSASAYSHRHATVPEIHQHLRRRLPFNDEDAHGFTNEVLAVDAVPRGSPKDPMSRPERTDALWRLLKLQLKIGNLGVVTLLQPAGWAWKAGRKWWKKREELAGWEAEMSGKTDEDDDEDWLPEDGHSDSAESESSGEENGDEEDDEGVETEDDLPANLYNDLSSPARSFRRHPRSSLSPSPSSPVASSSTSIVRHRSPALSNYDADLESDDLQGSTYSPILLAHHLSSPNSAPLTRRRYRSLLSQAGATPPQPERAFASAIVERRRNVLEKWDGQPPEMTEDRQRSCVVCTVEERTIIVWPCRCLALCEECRENLSERTPASQHLCPTCRAPVKGFSRIFIP